MIGTLLRVHWTNLARDRVAQLLTFLVPVAFFTVFAVVFTGSGSGTGRVRVAVVDESGSETGRRLVRAFEREKGLRVTTRGPASETDTTSVPLDRARAEAMVRAGRLPVAVVIPAGIDTSIGRFDGAGVPLVMLTDPSDRVAPQIVGGLLQKIAMTAMPDLMARRGIEQFDRHAGGLTAEQRRAVDTWLPGLAALGDSGEAAAGGSPEADSGGGPAISGMVRVKAQPVLGREQDTSMVSFFAAGIAVMFLLFSCANSAGALLEEIESGTLDRLLSSRLGMTGLLTGKFVYLTLMGVSQLTVMFLYAAFVFRLDLFDHLPGFAAMTLATAATCAAFGLLLATLCRTRQQLGGISTLVILMLSALGGSMFPRFLMSEGMQKAGRATFNAWALDGYTDVFWRNAGIAGILPEVGVLLAFMTAFLVAARMAARRWEQV